MTRLTPEDEETVRRIVYTHHGRPLNREAVAMFEEIDALRAENERLLQANSVFSAEFTEQILKARAEIATFRNASPSLKPLNIKGHCAVCDRRSGRGTMTASDTFYCEKCIATRRNECLDLRKELGE